MYVKQVLELTKVLDNDKFKRVLSRASHLREADDMLLDESLASDGIIITYRDRQYKKKIKLIVKVPLLLKAQRPEPDKLVQKLEKRIDDYFHHRYHLNDFTLTGTTLTTDINVGNQNTISAYIRVLQRIYKVKGFSPVVCEGFSEKNSFCLDGNSNDITFMIYNLRDTVADHLAETDLSRKEQKAVLSDAQGVLRTEVRLRSAKAFRSFVGDSSTTQQVAVLSKKATDVFISVFFKVVPYGAFHKKGKAIEMIRANVSDNRLKRRMLRLVDLIPEKKSLPGSEVIEL